MDLNSITRFVVYLYIIPLPLPDGMAMVGTDPCVLPIHLAPITVNWNVALCFPYTKCIDRCAMFCLVLKGLVYWYSITNYIYMTLTGS